MINKIGIIGAGAMGSGIAQVAATSGCDVVLYDLNNESLQHSSTNLQSMLNKLASKNKITVEEAVAIFGRIHFVNVLSGLSECEMIIEAIVENLEVKQKVFTEVETIVAPTCILASNTSSLSLTSIASACKISHRVVGIHFFNPAPLMNLVEIIPSIQTSDSVIQLVKKTIDNWGKITVLAKDSPGFIVNKVARPFYSEAIRIFEEGIADYRSIDAAMTGLGGFKMGPFTLMDYIGHDVNYAVTESVWKAFFYDGRYKPSFTQKRLVEAGYLGKKSGRGFYDYSNSENQMVKSDEGEQDEYVFRRILNMLINEAADTVHNGICSEEDIEIAMINGVNYPKGLLAWGKEIGYNEVVRDLDLLYDRYHEERYRVSPYLRDRVSLY